MRILMDITLICKNINSLERALREKRFLPYRVIVFFVSK